MQIEFNLPAIDRDETKKAVESILERYRMYALQVSLDRLPAITAKYSLMPFSNSLPGSSTESAAIANVDYEQERAKFIEWVARAVNRLTYVERSVIVMRYLSDEELYDYEVYSELNMSERKYYRIKSRIFYKLAFALKVEVYEEVAIS
ncbi:ArpU family phage packaging/lysis transcriptional regulator [Sporosarcina sp. FSL K6-5500]|uniref:ArpU family phage packaging/lysis transcriptional regulator n=1 Tax=Sporosarcina sp. FSL K6-5500 TaxID=2921558 RepID=UPI0030F83E13